MNTQFSGSYDQQPAPGYGPPGPMGGPAPHPPGQGQGMYNGYGQQGHAPPGAQTGGAPPQMKSGMQPPNMSSPLQNGPSPGGQGDARFGAPRGPTPGPPGPMSRPPTSFPGPPGLAATHGPRPSGPMPGPPGAGPAMRGPPPPGMAPVGQPPTSQFGAMNIADPHIQNQGLGVPPTSSPMTQQGYGAPPGQVIPPQSRSGAPPGMGPAHAGLGTPAAGTGPPHTGFGAPPTSMGPPQSGYGAPPTGSGPPPPSFGAPPTDMGAPPTSMGAPPINMGVPPQSGYGAPPAGTGHSQAGFGAPPTSMAPPHTGFGAPPAGQPLMPPTSIGPGPQGMPPASSGPPPMGQQLNQMPPSSYGQSQPGFGAPPAMGQPSPTTGFPPTNQYTGSLPSQYPAAGMQQNAVGAFPGGQPQAYNYSSQPGQRPAPTAQPQQPRKLDPDQMPSPIQVIEDDRKSHSGLFPTGSRGTLPPLVTTEFIAQDQGICNPRFIRSTMYNVPCTSDMLKGSHIPFVLTITPFAKLHEQEQPPPLVDLSDMGPVRCTRCKAYMNPFMQFLDGGRRFQCVFCGCATDVPPEYFAHLDHTGKRVDVYNRAELCLGSYEFTATTDYCKNGLPPKEPAFIFMIDVSYNSVKSGLVNLICENLKSDILVNLPKESGMEESAIRVGFVTYGKELHFYNVKGSLAQPQMMVVSDIEDMFVPLLDGCLVTLAESEAVIDSLLLQIPELFAESRETETVLGPVIQAGLDALKSADRCGKLLIFHTSLPTAEAPGKLKNRDDRKLLGTEKEKTLLTTQCPFYTKLGQECVAAGCSVDLFLFPNSYCDVASMSEVCRLTSGNIYKYSYFQADLDGERFIEDLKRNVSRPVAFDAILRVRTSTGIRPVDFYGNFYMANTTDVELAAIDCDQSICVEIKHDDKLPESEGAYIQVALLYTSVTGHRRLRVHNLALNCCTQMADLFRSCELDVLVNFLSKQAIRQTLNTNPKQVREYIMNEVSQILACYRKTCANPSSAGQLILPECMKLLPLYANCIIKNDGIQGGSEISTDDRSYLMHLINSMDVQSSSVFFYPKLLPLFDLDLDSHDEPTAVRCSVDRLQDTGIYLLENGLSMFLWTGLNVAPDMIQKVFGVPSAAQIDIDKCQLLDLDNPVSRRICGIVKKIRDKRSRYLKLSIVRQRDKLEPWFNHFLVEDKGLNGSASYVDFLCHIHKEIRNILS
ncbi:protein transport protein Sec24C-like [Gigantopelta aegis]|uniref:protein transport protein Sec24C-like n=1 Tax=Gigantopelta aegis TaxID=1735272 RepID=UPI001B887A41|nr:protein transport protein Sec24C-like [Gigantopelta aegis]XP_041364670.1 protein transport protein Sec24C-like [Gigantopelta aegis]